MTNDVAELQPPSPDDPTNWASQMRCCDSAVIVPSDSRSLVQNCGVFDETGAYCNDAVLWRRRPLMVPPELPKQLTLEDPRKGSFLWGGVIHAHFGHFLVESLGRVWGYGALPHRPDGLLFLEKRRQKDDLRDDAIVWHTPEDPVLTDFQFETFAQLGIDVPIGVVRRRVKTERLWIPGQGFGMFSMATGTEKFRTFVKERMGADVTPNGPKRLYISRSAYGAKRGGVIGEKIVEDRLKHDGYEVFHPQKSDLRTQIARYKAADEIVALDGSALHLVGMVIRSDQKVAMIKRRSSSTSKGIEDHLTAFAEKQPIIIDAIRRNWIRSDRSRVDRFSLAEVDIPALGQALAAEGMATAQDWPDVSEDAVQNMLTVITEGHSNRFRPQIPPDASALPDGIVAMCHGIEVPASEPVGPKWLVRKINNGRYEKEEISGALHLVGNEDRVLECGAGIGIVGTVVARNCRPEKILSFEANPNMIPVIEATYAHNEVDSIISVTHGALMSGEDTPQTVDFNIAKRFAFSSLDAPQRELVETVTVPVHNFSEVKAKLRPTVLLMDIEGGELSFLRNADLSGINTVVMEFHPETYGKDGMKECKQILRHAGFEPVRKKSSNSVWAARRMDSGQVDEQ